MSFTRYSASATRPAPAPRFACGILRQARSQKDIEMIRVAYEAMNRVDPEVALRALHPDFEWKTSPRFPLAGTYRGIDEVTSFLKTLREPFEEFVTEPEDFFERDDQIVAFVHVPLRPRENGATLEDRIAHLWTMRDGKAARCEVFLEREAALQALGLWEQDAED